MKLAGPEVKQTQEWGGGYAWFTDPSLWFPSSHPATEQFPHILWSCLAASSLVTLTYCFLTFFYPRSSSTLWFPNSVMGGRHLVISPWNFSAILFHLEWNTFLLWRSFGEHVTSNTRVLIKLLYIMEALTWKKPKGQQRFQLMNYIISKLLRVSGFCFVLNLKEM